MTHKARIAIGASALAAILLVAGAIGIAEVHTTLQEPAITASPYATLKNPEPEVITADKKAKLPKESRPTVKTSPAPKVVPAPIAETPDYFTPFNPIQERIPDAIVKIPAPAQRSHYPSKPPVSIVTPVLPKPSVPLRPPSLPLPQPVPAPALPAPVVPPVAPEKGILEPVIPIIPPIKIVIE